MKPALVLWLAQGFGTGRVPFVPGTFGSLVGLLWFALLLWPGRLWIYLAGSLLGIAASVWLCGRAEQLLRQTDPPSVVLDEIAAVPLCYLGWMVWMTRAQGGLPAIDRLFAGSDWPLAVGAFALFRLFDATKPPPVDAVQRLPGGWGVTMDDLLAAGYVNAVILVVNVARSAS